MADRSRIYSARQGCGEPHENRSSPTRRFSSKSLFRGKAASFAYVGHAGSLRSVEEKEHVRQIEQDEWDHRRNVLAIMQQYDIPVSKYYEIKYHLIGKIIGLSCYVIGRFMPYFFAGKLESGNVCEYFVMIRYFHSLGITEHDEILYEMGIKEKEHEVYFLEVIRDAKWLPLFERVFSWGAAASLNDVDLEDIYPVEKSGTYCKNYRESGDGGDAKRVDSISR